MKRRHECVSVYWGGLLVQKNGSSEKKIERKEGVGEKND